MKPGTKNSFKSLADIKVNGKSYKYFSLTKAEQNGLDGISKLPKSIKVLLMSTVMTEIFFFRGKLFLFSKKFPTEKKNREFQNFFV